MAVPISDVTRRVVYSGSAGVGPYSFSFEVLAETDLAVYKDQTLLTLTTDYSVTINVDGTGSVTLVVAATAANNITLVGDRAIARTTDFVTGGDLFANSLNDELDSLTIFAQQVKETADRGLKAPITDPTDVNMVLPIKASRIGKTLAFDADGNPTVGEDIGNWRGNWAAGTSYTVRDLVKDPVNSSIYRVNTAHTSSGSAPISGNADVAKFDLVIDATATADAEAAQAAAEAAQAAAEAAQAAAETAETNAETAETNAETAQTAAEAAQAAAESARDSALAAYDNFDDRYLGVKTSDPTLDNDGNPLIAGALYFNSVDGVMKLYTGSAWVAAYVSGDGFLSAANNLSDLTNAVTARQNLGVEIGVDVQAYDATIVVDADIGVSVQAYDADTAKTDTAQTFTASQRGTVTSDNDLSFDLSATNNFSCTPTAGGTLTFTNHTAGQSGFILLDNSSGYAITAAATTKINAADLTTISTAGVYVLSYFDNGTNAYIMVSRSFA